MREVYAKNEDFVYRNIAGETILVPIRNEIKKLHSIYSLNETACFIWQKLDGKKTIAEIVRVLESEYEIVKSSLESDIKEFIERLKEIGALQCLSQMPKMLKSCDWQKVKSFFEEEVKKVTLNARHLHNTVHRKGGKLVF